ncbi:MAG: DUF58 domain-containing protein [Pseudomonadales bacterium]|jgi:uncharacterized protein (DUF58 family)
MPNLTATSYGLLALISLMGITEQWAGGIWPWWRLAAAAYLLALTYEWLRIRRVHIRAALSGPGRFRLGRAVRLPLEVRHTSPVPIVVGYAIELPDVLESRGVGRGARRARLAAGADQRLPVEARAVAVGEGRLERLAVRVLGPLGLAWWRRPCALDGEIAVVPDALTTAERVTGLSLGGAGGVRRQGHGQELHHLRAYRPGDPRHRIDWKATARSGALVTRVLAESQHLDIMVVLDAGRTSRNRLDGLSQLGHYVNVTARFAEHATANGDRVGLVAISDRPLAVVPPGRDGQTITRIRQALGGLTTEPVESDPLVAAREMGRFVRHRCLVVVLTDLYGVEASGRLSQCIRLWAPRHLSMIVGLVGDELRTLESRAARDWLDPYVGLAAGMYRANLERGAGGLRALGAQALLCRPAHLERNVLARYGELRSNRRV